MRGNKTKKSVEMCTRNADKMYLDAKLSEHKESPKEMCNLIYLSHAFSMYCCPHYHEMSIKCCTQRWIS